MINLNYCFLSWWIANLGVVPLLLFAAFLLVPCLTFFAALLLRVTRVLETMTYLLSNFYYFSTHTPCVINKQESQRPSDKFSDFRVLPNLLALVKIMLCVGLFSSNIYSAQPRSLVMEVGEITTVLTPKLTRYSIGDKKVIKVKVNNGNILIKAIKPGLADIALWNKGVNNQESIKVTVLGKVKKKSYARLAKEIRKLGLTVKREHQFLKVSGTIKTKEIYKSFAKFYHSEKNIFLLENLILSPGIKKVLFSDFLFLGLNHFQDDLNCHPRNFFIECYDIDNSSNFKKKVNQEFIVSWISTTNINQTKQLKVKLRLFQYENLKGEHFSLGLYRVGGLLKNVLNNNPLSLIENNQVSINKSHYQFSTLAEPTVIGHLETPIKLRLGSEIPYTNTSREGQTTTQWRFAGLNVDLKIRKVLGEYRIDYKCGLSRPTTENSLQSNQQESSIQIKNNGKAMLFEIGFLVTDHQKHKLPLIEHIPLINHLFSSRNSEKVYKKVVGIIELQEIHASTR